MTTITILALLIAAVALTGWAALSNLERIVEHTAGRERLTYKTEKRITLGIISAAGVALVLTAVWMVG